MKIKNNAVKIFSLKADGKTMTIFPWHTVEVPDFFMKDTTLKVGLATGDLKWLDKPQEEKAHAEPQVAPEAASDPVNEEIPVETPEEPEAPSEPVKKASKKK